MNVSEEIQKLQDLHDKGVLSAAEFANAKQAVLNPQPSALPSSAPVGGVNSTQKTIGSFAGLAIVLTILFFSNPSQEKLERQINAAVSKSRSEAAMIVRAADFVTHRYTIERLNCAFFSIGIMTAEQRFGSQKSSGPVAFDILGMWFDFLSVK